MRSLLSPRRDAWTRFQQWRCPLVGGMVLLLLLGATLPSLADPPANCTTCKASGYWDAAQSQWPDIAVHTSLLWGTTDTTRVLWWGEDVSNGTRVHAWSVQPLDPIPGASVMRTDLLSGPTTVFCGGTSTLGDGRLLITGGEQLSTPGTDHTVIYDPVARTYTICGPGCADTLKERRYYPTSTTLGDSTVLATAGTKYALTVDFGGNDGTTLHNDLNTVFAMLAKPGTTGEFTTNNSGVVASREGLTMVLAADHSGAITTNERDIVYGGSDGSTFYNDVWKLTRDRDSLTWTWQELHPDIAIDGAPPARTQHSAIFLPQDTSVVIFGGRGSGGPVPNDVWKLYLNRCSEGQWRKPSLQGTGPSARYGHTAVYDLAPDVSPASNRMWVFGGTDGTTRYNDLYDLDFTAGQWEHRTSVGTPPAARESHTAIASNAGETDPNSVNDYGMFVFGGYDGSSFRNDVWELTLPGHGNPTQSIAWRQLSPAGTAPAGRAGHAALYDRRFDRMVVFGGKTSGTSRTGDVWALNSLADIDPPGNQSSWQLREAGTTTWARSGHAVAYELGAVDARRPERSDTQGGAWSLFNTVNASKLMQFYPYMFALPSGRVGYLGPGPDHHASVFDQTVGTWTQKTSSSGDIPGGSAAMYAPGKVLKGGHDGANTTGFKQAQTIAFDTSDGTSGWTDSQDMASGRTQLNLTLLADGKILASGGTSTWQDITTAVQRRRYGIRREARSRIPGAGPTL